MRFHPIRNIIFLFILTIISISAQAQTHKIVIKDINGAVVPFIPVICERSRHDVMSDADGVVFLDSRKYLPTDTLVTYSMFYEDYKIAFSDLVKQKEIVINPAVLQFAEVAVYPDDFVKRMVKEMSAFFANNYAKYYVSDVTHLRTIKCNDKYREFTGMKGLFVSQDFNQSYERLYFLDKNTLSCIPETVMRSNPFVAGSDNVLQAQNVVPAGDGIRKWDKESLKIEYHDRQNFHALTLKRALEIYSPINPHQVNSFNYTLGGSYLKGKDKIYIINFETRSKAFPKRTRIFGRGTIYYNSVTKLAEKITMENHQDQYSIFPRWKVSELLPSATRHSIEVDYTMNKGKIFTKSIVMKVAWVDPMVDDRFYRIQIQSRRNPIKNALQEYERFEFDNFAVFDKIINQQIKQYPIYRHSNLVVPYTAPFDSKLWSSVKWGDIDKDKLFRELTTSKETIFQQAEKNGMDMVFYYDGKLTEGSKVRVRNYYKLGAKIRAIVYKK